MPRRVYSIIAATFFVFISALIALSMDGRVLADGCIDQPNREPMQGAHWYWHYDREKNRKCWHLEDIEMGIAAPQRKDQPDAATTPTFSSMFSAFFRGGTTAHFKPPPQDTTSGEPRIIQSDPTKPLKIEDIAQQQPDIPEERAEERYVTPLSPAQRKALFEEYLRWEEIQRNIGILGIPARSP